MSFYSILHLGNYRRSFSVEQNQKSNMHFLWQRWIIRMCPPQWALCWKWQIAFNIFSRLWKKWRQYSIHVVLSCMHCVPPSHISFLGFISLHICDLQVSLILIKAEMLLSFFPKTLFSWQVTEKNIWICVSETPCIFKLYFPIYTKHNWSCHERHTNMSETLNHFLPLLLHIHENAKILLLFLLYFTSQVSSPV